MRLFLPFLVGAVALATAGSAFSQSAVTTPVGAMRMTVAAGTGTAKIRTLISAPLLGNPDHQGALVARVTGLTASTISSAGANWAAGELSLREAPYVVRFTSGQAKGLTLLISTSTQNTADTVTIDPGDASFVDLTTLGIATGSSSGDTFEIIPCDTLDSLFGTPETSGVRGGSSPSVADTVVIQDTYGNALTYYYSTTLGRWTRQALGTPDATHTPIRPDSGIAYFRLENSPMSFVVTGTVPSTDRKALVKNSGLTYLANSWPVDRKLSEFALNTTPGWLSGSTPASADIVVVGNSNYYHDGSNWRRQVLGSPIEDPSIPAGASVMINKKGSGNGASLLTQALPYNLDPEPMN